MKIRIYRHRTLYVSAEVHQQSYVLPSVSCLYSNSSVYLLTYVYRYFYVVCVWCVCIYVWLYICVVHTTVYMHAGARAEHLGSFSVALSAIALRQSLTQSSVQLTGACASSASLGLQEHMANPALVFTGNLCCRVSKHHKVTYIIHISRVYILS